MKKILHVTNHLYGAAGAERQLMLNVTALDKSRFENYICCIEKSRDLALEASNLGIPVFSLDAAGKPQWPRAVLRMRKLVRSLKIDLIHTSLFEADIIGGIAGRLCGVPVVSTLCNIGGEPERLIDDPHLNRLKLAVTTKLWGLGIRCFHRHSIAISNAVKDSAIRTYGVPARKLTVIYRALSDFWITESTGVRSEELRQELDLGEAYPVLLNVARLVPQKGQRYLIQAMPEVVARFPQVRLLIAGEGSLRESLVSMSRELGVDKHVSFLGRRSDIKGLLAISDIFVFPSVFEGLGGALLEAAATGRPTVASRVGPVPEVVEDGGSGLLVPIQSPEALAEAIIRLSADRELAQAMGQRARQVALEKFTINQTIKQLEEVYDYQLDGQGRASQGRSSGRAAEVRVKH